MTGKAVFRQDRPDVAVVLQRLGTSPREGATEPDRHERDAEKRISGIDHRANLDSVKIRPGSDERDLRALKDAV
jgi:hypothetical protein